MIHLKLSALGLCALAVSGCMRDPAPQGFHYADPPLPPGVTAALRPDISPDLLLVRDGCYFIYSEPGVSSSIAPLINSEGTAQICVM